MTVRMLQAAGNYAADQVVDLPDRQAQNLIRTGYAVASSASTPSKESTAVARTPGAKGRPSKGPTEVRG